MKKLAKVFLALIVMLIVLSGCNNETTKAKIYSTYDELNGEKVGIVVGTVFADSIKNILPESEVIYYNTISDEITGLSEGKVESVLTDYGIAIQACKKNADLTYFSNTFDEYGYGMIFSKTAEGNTLRESFNAFLESTYGDVNLEQRYRDLANADEYETYDYQSLPSINGTIRVATDAQSFPFIFLADNQLTGLEVELLYNFCLQEGYGLEFDTYDFAGVLAAVSSNKADIGASGLCYTKERSQKFNFSSLYVRIGSLLVVRKENIKNSFQTLADLSNADVSCTTGTVYDRFLTEYADNVNFQYYDTVTDAINALEQGKTAACLISSNVFNDFQADYQNLRIIDSIYTDNIAYILPQSSEPSLLQTQLDEFINALNQSGELEEIWAEWDKDKNKIVDYSTLKATNGTIRFAMSSSMGSPSNFIKDGKHCGIDIDIMVRFAKEYGYDIEFQDYNFAGVLAAVTSGKADVGGANITKTEERMKSMNFTEPYFIGYVYAVTIDDSFTNESTTFIDKLCDNFNKTFIKEDRYKLFLSGIKTTLLITLSSCVIGTLLGFILYFIFKNSGSICAKLLNAYSWFISGLPTVVLLMIFYYVIFVKTSLSAELISIIVFSILFSLAVFSILKTCFMAVDKGQFEAGYALGYSKARTITNIIIPEIAPMFFPSYRGEIVGLIKATSIVGYIAVQDLTKVSDIVRSRTYEAFFPLIAITIIYFLLTLFLDLFSRFVERKVNTKNRKIKDIMKGVKTR